MHSHDDSTSCDIDALEQRVLLALCNGHLSLSAELASYKWHDAEHRIVFEALSKISTCDVATLRELLPAQATRMGFPDVDWAAYFTGGSNSGGDAESLIRELLERAA